MSAVATSPLSISPAQDTEKRVFAIEDHDEAYALWKKHNVKNQTLVHIDAHIDIAWFNAASPRDLLNARNTQELDRMLASVPVWNPSPDDKTHKPDIGNYICSAIRDGIVQRAYWVVPDDFLNSPRRIISWKKALEDIVGRVPGKKAPVTTDKKKIRTRFLDCELIVCAFNALPRISSSALLDIDTDFFVTNHDAAYRKEFLYLKKLLPWMWPEELADMLREKGIDSNFITIAYSVEGHYTPIEYKFLGDWLKLILEGNSRAEAMGYLKTAALRRYNGSAVEELRALQQAANLAPDYAPAHFLLSRAQYESGQIDEAKGSYRKAINLDGSHRTRYNNAADIFFELGLFDRMGREQERMLQFDPDNAFIIAGRGERFLFQKQYVQAEVEFKKAVELKPHSERIRYMLAKTLYLQEKYDDASILLKKTLEDKPFHLQTRLLLGSISERKRLYKEALEHYKIILRLGYCAPGVYMALAKLYFLQCKFKKSANCIKKWVALIPIEVKMHFISLWKQLIFRRRVVKYVRT